MKIVLAACERSCSESIAAAGAESYGYPWGIAWHSNMTQWTTALRRTKAAVAERCNPEVEAWCPPLIINAWNECAQPPFPFRLRFHISLASAAPPPLISGMFPYRACGWHHGTR